MATGDVSGRWLGIITIISSFAFVIIIAAYPVQIHNIGVWVIKNVIATRAFGAVIFYGILAATAFFVTVIPLFLIFKGRDWYRSWQGRDYRKYDDPQYRE